MVVSVRSFAQDLTAPMWVSRHVGQALPHTTLKGGDAVVRTRTPAVGHAGRRRGASLAWPT